MSARMEHAMSLADACWGKAYRTAPKFVETYFDLMETYLLRNQYIRGDEPRKVAAVNKLRRPKSLHHNTWPSGVRALMLLGWIEKVEDVTPQEAHNHMPTVSRWRSMIYGGRKRK